MKTVYRICSLMTILEIVMALSGLTPVCYAQQLQATVAPNDLDKQAVGQVKTEDLRTDLREDQLKRLFMQALAKSEGGDYQGAIEVYNQVLSIQPNLAQARFNRAIAHRDLGNTQASVEDFKQGIADLTELLNKDPNDVLTYNDRGFGHMLLGDYKAALKDFNQAIKLETGDSVLPYLNRVLVLTKLNDYRRAIEDLEQNLGNSPDHWKWMYYFVRGTVRFGTGDNNGVIEEYSQCINLMPNNTIFAVEAYVARGLAYLNLKDKQRASKDFNKALNLLPNLAQAYYNRGIFYKNLGVDREAVENLQKAAALFSTQGKIAEYQQVQDRVRELQKK